MSKNRMAAKVGVSDGQGGMRELRDLRFEKGRWPHRLDVPSDRADDWTAYLAAEAEHRGWQASALTEHDPQE